MFHVFQWFFAAAFIAGYVSLYLWKGAPACNRILAQVARACAIVFVAAASVIAVCMLLDWFGHFGRRYPSHSFSAALVMIVVGLVFYKLAIYAFGKNDAQSVPSNSNRR